MAVPKPLAFGTLSLQEISIAVQIHCGKASSNNVTCARTCCQFCSRTERKPAFSIRTEFSVSTGAVGAVTGTLTGTGEAAPPGSSLDEYISTGAMRGFITGTGGGLIQGYAGGAGTAGDIVSQIAHGGIAGLVSGAALGWVDYKDFTRVYLKPAQEVAQKNAAPLQLHAPSLGNLGNLVKYIGVGSGKGGITLIPNLDRLLFQSFPPILTYGIGYGATSYEWEHINKIPSFSVSGSQKF